MTFSSRHDQRFWSSFVKVTPTSQYNAAATEFEVAVVSQPSVTHSKRPTSWCCCWWNDVAQSRVFFNSHWERNHETLTHFTPKFPNPLFLFAPSLFASAFCWTFHFFPSISFMSSFSFPSQSSAQLVFFSFLRPCRLLVRWNLRIEFILFNSITSQISLSPPAFPFLLLCEKGKSENCLKERAEKELRHIDADVFHLYAYKGEEF